MEKGSTPLGPGGTVWPMWPGEFNHPRLVPLADTPYPWARDDAFFVSAVPGQPARIADLGRGTARLALRPAAAFDIGLMTSHVAQFLSADEEWRHPLADLKRGLVPGGRLAFDTRAPRARGRGQRTQHRHAPVPLRAGRPFPARPGRFHHRPHVRRLAPRAHRPWRR